MTPIYTSRSQLEAYQACPRKYLYEYVWEGGLDLDMSALALNTGSAVHLAAETILKDGGGQTHSALQRGLAQAVASEPFAALPTEEDRDLVTALVRTWWLHGLPALAGWKVEDVEREEVFDYFLEPSSEAYGVEMDAAAVVRFQSRSDWVARAPEAGTERPLGPLALNGLPVPPGLYNWNLKIWRSCDPRGCPSGKCGWCSACRRKALQTDAQTYTELLGAERRLGERFVGVIYQILIKQDHPLVWAFRHPQTGAMFFRSSWRCSAAHENTHKKKPDLCPGDRFHKLPEGFERVLVRDFPGGQEAHFERLRAEEPALLSDMHVILGPMPRPSDYLMEEWTEMWLPRAATLATAAEETERLRKGGNPEALERHLRKEWPKHTAHGNCVKVYGGRCPAYAICHEGADPSGWPRRVANHPIGDEHGT